MLVSARVVPLLNSEFLSDTSYVDQYNLALCCNRQTKRNLLAPLLLERIDVPAYMSLVQWIDITRLVDEPEAESSRAVALLKRQLSATDSTTRLDYDVFISYSHADSMFSEKILRALTTERPDLNVFFDTQALKTGALWQQVLYNCLDTCKIVIAVVSSNYLSSVICNEEFNISLARHIEHKRFEFIVVTLNTDISSIMSNSKLNLPIFEVDGSDTSIDNNIIIDQVVKSVFKIIDTEKRHDKNTIDLKYLLQGYREKPIRQLISDSNEQEEPVFNIPSFTLRNNLFTTSTNHHTIYISYANSDKLIVSKMAEIIKRRIKGDCTVVLSSSGRSPDESSLENDVTYVVFISRRYLALKLQLEHLNQILFKQRRQRDRKIMFVCATEYMNDAPTYVKLLHYDMCLDDPVWGDMSTRSDPIEGTAGEGAIACRQREEMGTDAGTVSIDNAFNYLASKIALNLKYPCRNNKGLFINVAKDIDVKTDNF